jgi:hypothetical protein
MRPASTNSTSPPTGVHARPPRTLPHLEFGAKLRRAQKLLDQFPAGLDGGAVPRGDLPGLFPADGSDGAFEISNASFPRVALDDVMQALLGKADGGRFVEAVLCGLARNQVTYGDHNLFLLGVSP